MAYSEKFLVFFINCVGDGIMKNMMLGCDRWSQCHISLLNK